MRQNTVDVSGRGYECGVLDDFIARVWSGHSGTLIVHGEPGVGKTALLTYVEKNTQGCGVIRAGGVESEMELAYAGLQMLCAPLMTRIDVLPKPQAAALRIAFGLSDGPAPDRLLMGLAVLSLLADGAERQPLLCVVDDVQWLDRTSTQTLAFVARRLGAEAVGLVMATRDLDAELRGLPELGVKGLSDGDARALLDAVLTAPLDERVRDQLILESRGNPLALLELLRGVSVHELAGGFGLPSSARLSAALEDGFSRRIVACPDDTRRLLLLAAAEPLGDPTLMWLAAAQLGITEEAAGPAIDAGLATFGTRVRFRHPLVRSATYRSASLHEKRLVHRALAEATDPSVDPARRAWHRAHGAAGPDDAIAAELEQSANQAKARGGLAAAAAFHAKAAMLTLNPSERSERALAAASAKVDAGAFDDAVELLAMAEAGSLSDGQRARADLVRAQLSHLTGRGSDAPPLLLQAAKRLESIDTVLARTSYLDALSAAMFASRLAVGGGVVDVARAVQASSPPSDPQIIDLLLDGLAAHFVDGYAAGRDILQRAVSAARDAPASAIDLRCLWLAAVAAIHLWDDESWDVLSARTVDMAREAGALTQLPLALSLRAVMLLAAGELNAAADLIGEAETVTAATGDSVSPHGALGLAAMRGRLHEASSLIDATTSDVLRRGEGVAVTIAEWATAVLNNGTGDYGKALVAAKSAAEHPADIGVASWAAVELVEAATRSGERDIAAAAVEDLQEMTTASRTDWSLGIEARSRAMLGIGSDVEHLYREAVERLGRTRMRAELARTHLLYGEWLRRERRRTDARTQLRIAHTMLDAMGMEAFAERARHELQATGETARTRAVVRSRAALTPQEAQIARLARDGLSNPEIGERLFISARTVQYHLRKVFTKFDIRSRSQLDRVLAEVRPNR